MAGFWPIKFCLWIFLLGITFVFPNSAMSGYGQFARILAGIWLLVQMIILLDFIYDVNEWLLKKVSLQQIAIAAGPNAAAICTQDLGSVAVFCISITLGTIYDGKLVACILVTK